MIDANEIRKEFPILTEFEDLIYLDSAATAQRPLQVISAIGSFYKYKNSNVARGIYKLAEEATLQYEEVRKKTQSFINAENTEEIIFTKNTTEGCNLVMRGWGEKFISSGDRIVVTMMEHHSNFVPWQQLAKRKKAKLEVVDITDQGELDFSDLENKIKGAKIIAVSGASNVLGTVNDVKKISSMAHSEGALCFVDGAQLVPSMPVDVKDIGCDFLSFSGHKMMAPFGSGVLYGRKEILESMDPFLYGSEMIRSVSIEETEWNDLPHKFESGTPNVAAIIGLGAAIDYLRKIGMEDVKKYKQSLTKHLLQRLSEVPDLAVLGPADPGKRTSLAAFTLDKIHPHDVAALLSEDNICVRSGHHCAMPLHEMLKIPASTRASLYIYNKEDEIDKLAESLEKVRKIFG